MELASGEYLADRFQVIDRLAKGGETPLYLAADRSIQSDLGSLKVLVAIQVLNHKNHNRLVLREELEKLQHIKNEYLLNIYEIIPEKKRLAVTLEPFEGSYLVELMKERIFSSYEIIQILYRVASGIEMLHAKNFVHGAISEWTILINNENFPKIETLSKDYQQHLSKSIDIKGLGLLGLQLVKGRHYQSQSRMINYLNLSWILEVPRDDRLINFLENILGCDNQNNQIEISDVKLQLEKLLNETKSDQSNNQNSFSLIISSSFIVKIICLFLIACLILICLGMPLLLK